jgi:hypothetical protein
MMAIRIFILLYQKRGPAVRHDGLPLQSKRVLLSNRKRNIQQGFLGSAKGRELKGIREADFQAGLLDRTLRFLCSS